ncbi:class I SAM-dependent methyltransferase [Oricola sp.]|uniref:class I SAM-dependent methyltransferase n=1 Tax=Oricola sp. TaxID=1979950 RepID=UPI0025EB9B29|nr:class I SAM-dependent methyltransferase [Oricola sp.]MCI5077810.1 class I SAM-dependent methyltransferase [Oricola sp.]
MATIGFKSDAHSLITPEEIKGHSLGETAPFEAAELTARTAQLTLILETARQAFAKKEPAADVVHQLAGQLHLLRHQAAPAVWRELIPIAQQHPVSEYLMQDPFTSWSFNKPRGYSGDAGLLDIYYKHPAADYVINSSTELGREIYAYTSDAESSKAGRERKELLAKLVDGTAERVGSDAEVLAIACGHLREAEISKAVKDGTIKRWIGLDQDPMSVAIVNAGHVGTAVTAIEGSVRGILRRSYDLGTFDLVYASGLFDYLPKNVGVRLLQRALEFVRPGGEFLFANFSDEITTDGYMETFMDWPLILRSDDDMLDIINSSVDRNKVEIDVFYGANRNVVYGKVKKLAE